MIFNPHTNTHLYICTYPTGRGRKRSSKQQNGLSINSALIFSSVTVIPEFIVYLQREIRFRGWQARSQYFKIQPMQCFNQRIQTRSQYFKIQPMQCLGGFKENSFRRGLQKSLHKVPFNLMPVCTLDADGTKKLIFSFIFF